VYVAKTGERGEKDAIRIDHANRVTVERCRIESWHRAGIHVHASRDISITASEWVGGANTPDRFCVAIDGGSSGVRVERCKFGIGIGIAVAVGIADTEAVPAIEGTTRDATTPVPSLAENVTVEHCVSDRPQRFAAFGSCRTVVVRANTVLSPGAAWEVAATPKGRCPPTDVTIISNLITWEPGAMQQFSVAAAGAEPAGIAIESNLWWSLELPAAKSLLGGFVGAVKTPQILDRDPKLDNYATPQDEMAKAFGRGAP